MTGKLTKEEKEKWKKIIANYLNDSKDELPLTNFDLRHIQYCFKLLKEAVKMHEEQKRLLTIANTSSHQAIEEYKKTILEKEEEIDRQEENSISNIKIRDDLSITEKENLPPSSDYLNLSPAQRVALEIFLRNPKNRPEIDYYKNSIQEIYEVAKGLTSSISNCQDKILILKEKKQRCTDKATSTKMELELLNQQSIYKNFLSKLEELKNETEFYKQRIIDAKLTVLENFKNWYEDIGEQEFNDLSEDRDYPFPESRSKSASEVQSDDFKTIWKQNEEKLKSCDTLTSREKEPFESFIADDTNKLDIPGLEFDKFAMHEGSSHFGRSKRSPFKITSDLWKSKSNDYCLFNSTNHVKATDVDNPPRNGIIRNADFRGFTQNSCLAPKQQHYRQAPVYSFPGMQGFNNPFSVRNKHRSRSRSPQKFFAFDTFFPEDNKGSRQKDKYNDSSFSVVYQDIMGSNGFSNGRKLDRNINSLVPERPYSTNSSEIEFNVVGDQPDLKHSAPRPWSPLYDKGKKENNQCNNNYRSLIKNNANACTFKPRGINKENNFDLEISTPEKEYGKVLTSPYHLQNNLNTNPPKLSVFECDDLFLPDDNVEFRSFIKTIPFTGDPEVDEEIVKFYRTKFVCKTTS